MLNRNHEPQYIHVRCDECGGVIGTWDRERYTCETCHKEFKLYKLEYDGVVINDVTGWIFPIRDKNKPKE